mmetsp:Transcript_30257/g.87231  ORF Transcript_30257/g.87231 Transcript_30257/m.87231 type:complete len:200 (-) Transcript_30257:249-848(-)
MLCMPSGWMVLRGNAPQPSSSMGADGTGLDGGLLDCIHWASAGGAACCFSLNDLNLNSRAWSRNCRNIMYTRPSCCWAFRKQSTNLSYSSSPLSSQSIKRKRSLRSFCPMFNSFKFSLTFGILYPSNNSCSLIVPFPSESTLFITACHMSRHASSLFFFSFKRSSLFNSRASFALSTMTARTKFVKPNCTVTNDKAKIM